MDTEKCRYGKKHSFIEIFCGKDLEAAERGAAEYDIIRFCEVCGIIEIMTVGGIFKRRLIPQIAKEVLAAGKADTEPIQLEYDEIFYIDDQVLGQ